MKIPRGNIEYLGISRYSRDCDEIASCMAPFEVVGFAPNGAPPRRREFACDAHAVLDVFQPTLLREGSLLRC